MPAFDRLAPPVRKWVRQQGWHALREIQARTIDAVLDHDRDLIVAARTAAGKTEAACLPLISQVCADAPAAGAGIDILYVGPLKALINDQAHRLGDICRAADIPVTPWHGDVAASVKRNALTAPGGLLLITPESLEALLVRRGAEIPGLLGAVRAIVIDELHAFLDTERGMHLRALLSRLELALGRRVRRIGLSATLGDMDLAKSALRPGDPDAVDLIETPEAGGELRLQVRGHVCDPDAPEAATRAVARHLFDTLRTRNNLVFAGSRRRAEEYANALRLLSETAGVPQEFFPHHGSLSRESRAALEARLKRAAPPTTAICTSTLELGIDIGDVICVAQLAPPYSVASLRQRLGRSGRRAGNPAILRHYAVETRLEASSSAVDRLRPGLLRTLAMIELLLDGWCEPPADGALHLSTLVHQVLAVIAERGGARARELFRTLCRHGPFRTVDQGLFADVLRAMGAPEAGLLEQAPDGTLLPGPEGEKLIAHHSFFAVFESDAEYRIVHDGKVLGTLPLTNVVTAGALIVFSGRQWEIVGTPENRTLHVRPARGGRPPRFGNATGEIHDRVVARMFELYASDVVPRYLDGAAVALLAEARAAFEELRLGQRSMVPTGSGSTLLVTRRGTRATDTLRLALSGVGFRARVHDGMLDVQTPPDAPPLAAAIEEIARKPDASTIPEEADLVREKMHRYLPRGLLLRDALSSRLDLSALPPLCQAILREPPPRFRQISRRRQPGVPISSHCSGALQR